MTKSTKIVAALGVAAGIGIAALPLGSFAAELIPFDYTTATSTGKDVTVKLSVGEAIAVATDATVCGDITLQVNQTGSCKHKIAGGTNAVNGFTLSVADKDSELALVNATGSGTATAKIAAKDGALTAGMANGGWNISGGALSEKAITVAPQTVIKTKGAKEVATEMTYNFATQKNQEIGDYTDVITYTIAKNESAVSTEEGLDGATILTGNE